MPLIDFGDVPLLLNTEQPLPGIPIAGFNSIHVQVLCFFIIVGGTAPVGKVEAVLETSNDGAFWKRLGGFGSATLLSSDTTLTPTGTQGAAGSNSGGAGAYANALGSLYVRVVLKLTCTGTPTSANATVRTIVNTYNG